MLVGDKEQEKRKSTISMEANIPLIQLRNLLCSRERMAGLDSALAREPFFFSACADSIADVDLALTQSLTHSIPLAWWWALRCYLQAAMDTVNIPEVFQTRKAKILEELSLPDAEYTDLSPKGSVDEGIRDLIRDINALPGLVTTSSCAGRMSVFLEGRKKTGAPQQESESRQFAPSGGKGTGRWLYVSHDPFVRPSNQDPDTPMSLHEVFGLLPGNGNPPTSSQPLRLVRFHFDPLVCRVVECP